MSYKVITIDVFEKQAKKLFKKYHSLKLELLNLVEELEKKPETGIKLANNCYKIRIAIASKGKGKSGGARIITHFLVSKSEIYLLSIYDKSEKQNLTDNEITELLSWIPNSK